MGRLFLTYAEKEDSVYVCRCCFTHLSTSEQIISKVSGPTKARTDLMPFTIIVGCLKESVKVETTEPRVSVVLKLFLFSCFLKDLFLAF
jgi:uncharacterized protein (DUF952 family)